MYLKANVAGQLLLDLGHLESKAVSPWRGGGCQRLKDRDREGDNGIMAASSRDGVSGWGGNFLGFATNQARGGTPVVFCFFFLRPYL